MNNGFDVVFEIKKLSAFRSRCQNILTVRSMVYRRRTFRDENFLQLCCFSFPDVDVEL